MVERNRRSILLLLLLSLAPDPPLLLAFKLVVKQEKGFLVRFGRTNDSEHSLASLVMRGLSNGDFRAGQTTDFGNLCAAAANNATDHI